MLFKQAVLEDIKRGKVSLAFRRWTKPTVKVGTELHTKAGLIGITSLIAMDAAKITAADARKAGYDSRDALRLELSGRDGTVYRIGLKYLGADPRIALRKDDKLDIATRNDLVARLAQFDKMAPWTQQALDLIDQFPGRRAPELAAMLGMETLPFKARVRKLKGLGMTESLDIGYRLAPRGKALLRILRKEHR